MSRITFPIIDTEIRKISESKDGYIEFSEKHIKYFSYLHCSEKNEEEIWEDVFAHKIVILDKKLILSVVIAYGHRDKKYFIECGSREDGFSFFIDDWIEAKRIFDKIIEWKYNE